ncbi:alpha/beta hydrolase [Bradyrhizobium sp. dw_411]|uniref:alpha/beta hydrolase n=1 Tax=Bradyrhizobium sp. dw_411 TaxID=2720082 RepID=UPI001BCA89AD|nr:alpha/beta hydrolase [Bradyrhizobium sp. dw_411]
MIETKRILIATLLVATLLTAAVIPGLSIAQTRPLPDRGDSPLQQDAAVSADANERIIDVPLTGGERQRVLYAAPARPKATIVMLPGGAGKVGLRRDGEVRHGDNFVVRTRALWIQRGYAVLIPDTVDHANLRGLRSSPEYAALVLDLVRVAREQAPGPVFLLGTSQGSIAAMNGAAHAPPGAIAGVVLTESVSQMGGSGVFSAAPQDVRVPALIVSNKDDQCNVAPPADAPRIAAAMTNSVSVRVLSVAGGVQKSRKLCGSLTPHGYFGIESEVISQIDNWMQQRSQ